MFFLDAYEKGPRCIYEPFAGYLHLFPRTVAWIAMAADPVWIPGIYNLFALILALTVVAALFSPRIDLPAKPFLALALVLAPHTGEVLVNLTNSQWHLAVALVLVLIARDPATVAQCLADGIAIILGGLTGPFVVFLAPLFVVRAVGRRTLSSTLLALAVVAFAGVQLSNLLHEQAAFVRPGPVDLKLLGSVMSSRLYGTFWGGYGGGIFATTGAWIALGVGVTAVGAYLAFRPGPYAESRRLIAGAWVCLVVPVGLKFCREAAVLTSPRNGDRYFYLPHVFLAWLIVVERARTTGWRRRLALAALIAALTANLKTLRVPPLTDYAWSQHVQPIREGKAFVIPINPDGWTIVSGGKNSRR